MWQRFVHKIKRRTKNRKVRALLYFTIVFFGLLLTLTVSLQPQRLLQFANEDEAPPFFGCIHLGESDTTNCGTKLGKAGDMTFKLYGRPFDPTKQEVYYGDRLNGSLKYTNVGTQVLTMGSIGLGGTPVTGGGEGFQMLPYKSNVSLAPKASTSVDNASHRIESKDGSGKYRIGPKLKTTSGVAVPVSDDESTQITVNATCTALRTKELTETDKKNLKTFCGSNPKSKLCTSKEYCQIVKGGSCPQSDTNPATPGVQCDEFVYMPQPEQDMLEELCKVYPDSDACENFCGRTVGTKLCPKKYLFIDTTTGKPFEGDGGSQTALYVKDPNKLKFEYSQYYPVGAVKNNTPTTAEGQLAASPQAVAGVLVKVGKELAEAGAGADYCKSDADCNRGGAPGHTFACTPAGSPTATCREVAAPVAPAAPAPIVPAAAPAPIAAPAAPATKPSSCGPLKTSINPTYIPCGAPVDAKPAGAAGNAPPGGAATANPGPPPPPPLPAAGQNGNLGNAFVPCDAPVDANSRNATTGAFSPLNGGKYPPTCDGHYSSAAGTAGYPVGDKGSLQLRDTTGKLGATVAGVNKNDLPTTCTSANQTGCLYQCTVNGKLGYCNRDAKPVMGQTGYDSSCGSSSLRDSNAADDPNGAQQFACCAKSTKKSLNNNGCCGSACGVWRQDIGPGGSTVLRGAPGSNTVCANLAKDGKDKASGVSSAQADIIKRTDSCRLVNDASTGDKAGTAASLPGSSDSDGVSVCDPRSRDYEKNKDTDACKNLNKSPLNTTGTTNTTNTNNTTGITPKSCSDQGKWFNPDNNACMDPISKNTTQLDDGASIGQYCANFDCGKQVAVYCQNMCKSQSCHLPNPAGGTVYCGKSNGPLEVNLYNVKVNDCQSQQKWYNPQGNNCIDPIEKRTTLLNDDASIGRTCLNLESCKKDVSVYCQNVCKSQSCHLPNPAGGLVYCGKSEGPVEVNVY